MAKVALLIGVSEYQSGLSPLPAAVKDVEALQRVLQDRELGEFDAVQTLLNPEPYVLQSEIETFFTGCAKDDLVLLYFSGHGIKDDRGNLYFATRITQKNANGDLVRSSTVSARFVHEMLDNCRAKRQAIILDCCFSGAFDRALRLKDDGSVDVSRQLGAEGRVVLTSSSSTQYSLEQSESELSLYTRYLVEGIETGAGDLDEDGYISIQELHHYAFKQVQATAPSMTPKLISIKDLGFEIVLSKARVTAPQLKYRKTLTGLVTGGRIRPAGRAVLDTLRQQSGLTLADADAIEAEVLRPYRERLVNLQKYRDALLAEAEHEYPLSPEAQETMAMLQKLLGLREEDITTIVQQFEAQFAQQSKLATSKPLQPTTSQSVISDSAPSNPQTSLTAEEFFNRGLNKHNAGDKQGAIADYTEAIRLKPDYADAYNNRGNAKSASGDKQGAIADYTEAIRLKPDYAHTYHNRGLAKSDLGDKQGAIKDYTKAIRLKPNYADAYNNRGLAKSDLGEKQWAIADYTKAIRLKPDHADAYHNRGVAKEILGDKQGAIADYTKAIHSKPDFATPYYIRGLAKSALGDKQLAIADYTEAICLKPDDAAAYRNRGLAKSDLGDKQGAIDDYTEAIRLKPDFAAAYYNRGLAKSDLGDKQEAIDDYTEAIRLKPDFAAAYYDRGFIKRNLGDKQGAIKDYHDAARLYQQQGNTQWYNNALNHLQELGQ